MSTPVIVAQGAAGVEAVNYASAIFPGGHIPAVGNTLLFFAFGTTDQHFSNVEQDTGPWTQVGEQYVSEGDGFSPATVMACFATEVTEGFPGAGYYYSFPLPEATDECNGYIFEIEQAGPPSLFQFLGIAKSPASVDWTTPTLTPIAPESIPLTGIGFSPNFPTIVDSPPDYTSDGGFTINELWTQVYTGPSTPDMTPVGPLAYTTSYPLVGVTFLCLIPPSPNVNRLNAHLRIDPAQLVLIPPDATLPFNQTLLYKVRKQYGTGFSSIPRGVFVSTAGTMDPPGVTSSGQAVLTPYEDTIGPFTVTFYEVP